MAESPTRLALIAHPSAGDGRSERVLLQTVLSLRETGWLVAVALPEAGVLADRLRSDGVLVEILPVPVLRKRDLGVRGVARFLRGSVTAEHRLESALRRLSPDVMVVSTMTQPGWTLAARLHRIPVLVHVQELADAPQLVREAIARPLTMADRVVADSPTTRDALLSVVPSLSARTVVLPTGIGAPREVVPARAEPTGGLRICCIARIAPGAGVRTVVDAFALLLADSGDARLEIAALSTDPTAVSRLHEQLDRLRVADRVTVRAATGDLWDVLAAADVAVVPSRAETSFGGTAVEAVLAGRPVVVTTTKGLADATDGFASAVPVDGDDPHDIVRALRRIAGQWSAFRRSALALAPVAADRFSPSAYRSSFATEVRAVAAGVLRPHHLLAA